MYNRIYLVFYTQIETVISFITFFELEKEPNVNYWLSVQFTLFKLSQTTLNFKNEKKNHVSFLVLFSTKFTSDILWSHTDFQWKIYHEL